MKDLNIKIGDVFAIPLDITHISSIKSFTRRKVESLGQRFSHCIVIGYNSSVGIKILISRNIEPWKETVSVEAFNTPLFEPIVISGLSILKNRWRKISLKDIDKFKNNYDSGIQTPVTVWLATDVEKAINGDTSPLTWNG